MTKQTKKLIAIFVVMVITMFAVIKAMQKSSQFMMSFQLIDIDMLNLQN